MICTPASLALVAALHLGQPAAAEPSNAVRPEVETTDSLAFQIGLALRCPVCQGMPIAESPSQMAQDMMVIVRKMVAEGKTKDEVYDYFVQRYDQWVLLAPKPEGFNLGLWILPIVALLFGAFLVWRYVKHPPPIASARKKSESADDGALYDDVTVVPSGDEDDSPNEDYLRAIRDEVRR